MDNTEMAQDALEHAHGGHGGHGGGDGVSTRSRLAAILVAVFAAIAVIIEMGANDAQTTYLARTITASDLWNEYQAKSVRRTIWSEAADALAATSPGTAAAAIAHARSEADRMADEPPASGMKQLAARAHAEEHVRDHAHHLHVQLERAVRVLQIGIVLTGLYLATRIEALVLVGLVLGLAAIAWGIVAATGLV